MSEKRFVQCEIEYGFANTTNIKKIDGIYDMQEEKTYRIEQISDLLNEQDDELHKYRTENAELHITILENEKEIDEQQATIEQLQDLCGKSDGENAKLRIENEQLKEKLQSVTMLKDDYEELIESFEKKYGKNIEDVIDDE